MIVTKDIEYPDSDGIPMSDNTWQHRWIATLMWNASILFQDRQDVFVAGDHLIYPIRGDNKTRIAPDTYVAFGAEKKDRGSYKVWEEGGIFPQVVFEVYSPGNSQVGFAEKRSKYERFGAEEYYVLYPDYPNKFAGYLRKDGKLVEIDDMDGHVSPRLGIVFKIDIDEIEIYGPDGREWLSPDKLAIELTKQRDQARREISTETRKNRIVKKRAEAAEKRADEAVARAEALRAKLRSLGIDPDTVSS